jgi:NADH-quinone oxidoreductase subunit C
MEAPHIHALLVATFGEAVFGFTTEGTKDPFCRVNPARWAEVAKVLRDHDALAFDFLENVTAVDRPGTPETPGTIELVYHFFSYLRRHRFVVKIELPREAPRVRSLTPLWQSANWLEREQYDLLGVVFEGHPDLRRLLLPEDWAGHPLRKDYAPPAEYRGMRTTRPSPLDLLPKFDRAQAAAAASGAPGDPTKVPS